AISGATASSYVPVTADIGNTLTVSVTAANTGGSSPRVTSAPTGAVAAAGGLVISGAAQVGQTLTASGGSGGYQWYREGSAISGATFSTYTLQGSDQGDLISVYSNSVFSALAGPVIGTVVFYVSSSTGSDSNPGTFSQPWKTLAHVNGQTFAPGTSILFKRGDTWRTDGNSPNSLGAQLAPASSGSSGSPIVFDAYGTGANPIIDGSFDASATGAWQGTGTTNVWESVQTFPPSSGNTNGLPYNRGNDVGNILWGFSFIGGTNVPRALTNASIGQMTGGGTGGVWYNPGDGTAHLTSQGQWNFNTDNWRVQVHSTSNPATAMPGLSLAIDTACIYAFDVSYLIFQNFTLQYCGMSPIMSESTNNNIIVRDTVVQWGGGGNIGGASNANSRYGDGIDIEGSAQGWLVERNWFYQMYDAAVGPQCGGSYQNNITIRNNVVSQMNNPFSSFIFNSPQANGYYIYNNTIYGNQGGWSCVPSAQRPNGTPNLLGFYPGVLGQTNMLIKNNIWAGIGGAGSNPGFGINGTEWSSASNPANPFAGSVWLDYNCWPVNTHSSSAQQIALHSGNYTLSSWATGTSAAGSFTPALEVHGVFGQDPQFTSQSGLNFSPTTVSPCRNSGVNLYSQGVVWDINKNPRPTSGPFTIGAFQ
ncbi:MAG: hypothetical protein WA231_09430, partial [Methylocella sp.]